MSLPVLFACTRAHHSDPLLPWLLAGADAARDAPHLRPPVTAKWELATRRRWATPRRPRVEFARGGLGPAPGVSVRPRWEAYARGARAPRPSSMPARRRQHTTRRVTHKGRERSGGGMCSCAFFGRCAPGSASREAVARGPLISWERLLSWMRLKLRPMLSRHAMPHVPVHVTCAMYLSQWPWRLLGVLLLPLAPVVPQPSAPSVVASCWMEPRSWPIPMARRSRALVRGRCGNSRVCRGRRTSE